MEKKEPKLPNRTDIPIDIPANKLKYISGPIKSKSDTISKSYTFTASRPIEHKEEISSVKDLMRSMPWFFTPEERNNDYKQSLKLESRKLLEKPFTAGNAYNVFGNKKFPNAKIQCFKCGEIIEFIVDFFVHCIGGHGASTYETVEAFENVLNRI